MTRRDDRTPAARASMWRRTFLRGLSAGAAVAALGGATGVLADQASEQRARAQKRPDGRPRLPPDQYLVERLRPMGGDEGDPSPGHVQLRPMGGDEGDPSPGHVQLRVHGEVEAPYTLSFAELMALPQVEQHSDIHCVTKWSVLDAHFSGVRVSDLLARARLKSSARFLIFEANLDFTSNLPLREALAPDVLVAHHYEGRPLARAHGAPLRALVPSLYFWKSAKWLTGIRLSQYDQPGYWESRGYHNHGDPWKEERRGGSWR